MLSEVILKGFQGELKAPSKKPFLIEDSKHLSKSVLKLLLFSISTTQAQGDRIGRKGTHYGPWRVLLCASLTFLKFLMGFSPPPPLPHRGVLIPPRPST